MYQLFLTMLPIRALQFNPTLILSHTHIPHTHTHWGFHFHIWTFASKTWSLAMSIIWHIWMSDKNWLQKRRAKLKTVINNLNYNMFHLSTNVFVIFRIGPMQNTRKFKLLHQKLCNAYASGHSDITEATLFFKFVPYSLLFC